MKQIAATLCGLLMACSLGAKEPAKSTAASAVDFSADVATLPSHLLTRLDSAKYYGVSINETKLGNVWIYINKVIIPDRVAQEPLPSIPFHVPFPEFSGDSSSHLANTFGPGAVGSFYFSTDNCELNNSDKKDLQALIEYYKTVGVGHIVIEGRADSRHNPDYNFNLSTHRCEPFIKALFKEIPGVTIEYTAFGDASPVCEGTDSLSYALNRVVHIRPGVSAIATGIRGSKAKTTFVDASGSMNQYTASGYPPWRVIENMTWLEDEEVYVFSERTTFEQGRSLLVRWPNDTLSKYFPRGSTPLKSIMLYAALLGDSGAQYEFVTDGASSDNPVSYDKIIEIAQKRDVALSFISIGASTKHHAQMKRVALSTGGQVYLSQTAARDGRLFTRR